MRVSFITLLLLCYALLVSVLQKWHPCKYFWPAVYFIKHLYNLYTICFHIVSLVITSNISLCITPIKLIKSLLYYLSTFHQYNFTNVLLFKSAIYVFNVTSTEKFPELSKLHCLTWQFHIGSFVLERGSALFRTCPSFSLGISRVVPARKSSLFGHIINVLVPAGLFGLAGWVLASFFFLQTESSVFLCKTVDNESFLLRGAILVSYVAMSRAIETKMAGRNEKRSFSTVLRKNRGLWRVYFSCFLLASNWLRLGL